MNKNLKLILLLTTLLISLNSFSSIINIPTDYEQIQSGISAAVWGDTILIQPGTYVENIDFLGKSITVGSLFLTTQDTTYISQTIIDGNNNGAVVKFENNENSDAVLLGLTLINGSGKSVVVEEEDDYQLIQLRGGGIYCNYAQPRMNNLKIHNNSASSGGGIFLGFSQVIISECEISSNQVNDSYMFIDDGGGITAYQSEIEIINSKISSNATYGGDGGGFSIRASSFTIQNSEISGNTSQHGAGLYIGGSNGTLLDCLVFNNNASSSGGGIHNSSSDITLSNVDVFYNSSRNDGGGISCWYSDNLYLSNTTISYNTSDNSGGGIHNRNTSITFDPVNKSSIYENQAVLSKDIYSTEFVSVILDTFTVMEPTSIYASPRENFSFAIDNAMITQIDADIYISPEGSDIASGLSWENPLQTISSALGRIVPNSADPKTIYLASGTYSSTSNGEQFPINIPGNITLEGMGSDSTFLESEDSGVFEIYYAQNSKISNLNISNSAGAILADNSNLELENLVISNCERDNGAGIQANYSELICENIEVANNTGLNGAGIYLSHSDLTLFNSNIQGNSSLGNEYSQGYGGGLFAMYSDFLLENSVIQGNISDENGGGICARFSSGDLRNLKLIGNISHDAGGGLSCRFNSTISLESTTITRNKAQFGGGIFHSDFSDYGNTELLFSDENRCSIYLNYATSAKEFALGNFESHFMEVLLDTFVVQSPTDYHFYANSNESFALDIISPYYNQYNQDLYVSPQGDDNNPGTTPEQPVKTIFAASTKILSSPENPRTVHLLPGVYSSDSNNEFFPITVPAHTNYMGDLDGEVILDANHESSVLNLIELDDVSFANFTLQNGSDSGMKVITSNLSLENLKFRNNSSSEESGGGLNISNSEAVVSNSAFIQNSSIEKAGAIQVSGSSAHIFNSTIVQNSSENSVGAIDSYNSGVYLVNSIAWDNGENQLSVTTSGNSGMHIDYSDIQYGEVNIIAEDNTVVDYREHNLETDPMFMNPEAGVFYLEENSPCVDAGIDIFLIGYDEILHLDPEDYYASAPDLGAYEYGFVSNENEEVVPAKNILYPNYPNPFNPSTVIKYSLNPETAQNAKIEIFNIKGQLIKEFRFNKITESVNQVIWHGKDQNSNPVSSGVYFYKLEVDGSEVGKGKMLLLK